MRWVNVHLIETVAERSIAEIRVDALDKVALGDLLDDLIHTRLARTDDRAKHGLLADWLDDMVDKLGDFHQRLPVASKDDLAWIAWVRNRMLCVEHFAVNPVFARLNQLENPAHKVLVWLGERTVHSERVASRNVEINGELHAYQKGELERILVSHALD